MIDNIMVHDKKEVERLKEYFYILDNFSKDSPEYKIALKEVHKAITYFWFDYHHWWD